MAAVSQDPLSTNQPHIVTTATAAEKAASRWQRVDYWDLACLFYWSLLFVSFCVVADWPIDFRAEFRLENRAHKFFWLTTVWFSSLILTQTSLGFWKKLKLAGRMAMSPLTAIRFISGFLWDTRKTVAQIKKRFPTRSAFVGALFITIVGGAIAKSTPFLSAVYYAAWFELLLILRYCFSWTLNPIPTIERLKQWPKLANAKTSVIASLAKVEVHAPEVATAELLKRLESFKGMATYIPKVLRWLSGPKVMFLSFIAIFFFGATSALLLITTILRAEHFLTPNGVFAGEFFNGRWIDFLYISLNHFVSAEMYNVTVISPNIRFVLTALPYISLTLTLLLVLAFTMVGQTRVEASVRKVEDDLLAVVSDAVKQVSEKKEVILVDKRELTKNGQKAVVTTVLPEASPQAR